MSSAQDYAAFEPGSEELVAKLIEDHHGWATSIAKSVARSWNLDWQLDGLDGGAFEGLHFCARRYDPSMGVPFKAYARRRIHEASTEEARKSKSWQRAVGADTEVEQNAREVSARLFDVFPELRNGLLPASTEKLDEETMRTSVTQLLASASVLTTLHELEKGGVEKAVEYKRLVEILSGLEPVHQAILWKVYWEGMSMRGVASEWEIDELNVIREHKQLLSFLIPKLGNRNKGPEKLKIRPGLRTLAQKLKKDNYDAPFSSLLNQVGAWCLLLLGSVLALLGLK